MRSSQNRSFDVTRCVLHSTASKCKIVPKDRMTRLRNIATVNLDQANLSQVYSVIVQIA